MFTLKVKEGKKQGRKEIGEREKGRKEERKEGLVFDSCRNYRHSLKTNEESAILSIFLKRRRDMALRKNRKPFTKGLYN